MMSSLEREAVHQRRRRLEPRLKAVAFAEAAAIDTEVVLWLVTAKLEPAALGRGAVNVGHLPVRVKSAFRVSGAGARSALQRGRGLAERSASGTQSDRCRASDMAYLLLLSAPWSPRLMVIDSIHIKCVKMQLLFYNKHITKEANDGDPACARRSTSVSGSAKTDHTTARAGGPNRPETYDLIPRGRHRREPGRRRRPGPSA